jgi:AGCS family alanine or glycine:cation symporter
MNEQYAVAPWITGSVLAAMTAAVILGGIRSIAAVCQFLVPVMAGVYVFGCVALLTINADKVPAAIGLIFSEAFTGTAAIGGFVGAGLKEVVRAGVSRGLFSNESGLGSAPIAAAAARTPNPVRQALINSTGPFWDTVVVCALTGIVFVSSGVWETATDKAMLSRLAFDQLPVVGGLILTVALVTFVFSTILGWSYYGEKATEYLLGSRAILPYRLCWVAAVFVGTLASLNVVWTLADILNGLMAVPNLIALLALSGVLVAETAKHKDVLSGQSDE